MMELKLDEITPNNLIMVAANREEMKLRNLVRSEAIALGDEFGASKLYAEQLLAKCQWRAIRMHNHGYTRDELAQIFNVTTKEMAKWLKNENGMRVWL
jgi:hypothetical protein